ncbi:MAG: hypothetical protein K6A23_07185 [Butyrivibrio sp.]|nr:hypothetical protein [Butyrivibrio sp.]
MSKEKNLFNSITFDNTAYAQQILNESESKLKRVKIGLIIAAITSVISIIGYTATNNNLSTILMLVSLIGSLVSYIIGGGFMNALSWGVKIGKIGWIIMPFPVDIVTGLTASLFAILVFLFLPVIFVLLSYFQTKKDFDTAFMYLSQYQAANV